MEEKKDMPGILDYMIQPGFCVKENIIVDVNEAAKGFFLCSGMDVEPLLLTGREEYREFSGGCLYLTLSLEGQSLGATVTRTPEGDLFVLEQSADNRELCSMALAARELREPLSNVMITAKSLFALAAQQEDPHGKEQAARLNRGLLQMMRILSNMADANRYTTASRMETLAITRELDELFEKARSIVEQAGLHLTYEGLPDQIISLCDREQLERAVLNILSNAIKFTPKGGTISAKLTYRSNTLRLSIQDSGNGIEDSIRPHLFHRYLRQLTLEDSRYGIGLGMVLIRSAAANHGGTVLIDQPEGKGTRITMTIAIRQSTDTVLRSPISRVDYAGGHDHALLELSDCLPLSAFELED